ncbi:unnamed protein product [Adineta steineri]|uniref:Uncharacterized protein n=1 Tax=Adineta steineri TaxID=433720 RepID=A0A815Q6J8_9BILA|nr:unnamed protein product [Adineta steineri]CAF4083674.1 unnamed protein product [Adineta steineri]
MSKWYGAKPSFKPPSQEEIVRALGDTTKLSKIMQMALTTRTDESFDPIKTPESSDWLTQHEEEGQTMSSFLRKSLGGVSYGDLKTIFLQPVGSFDHQRAPSLDVIVKFTRTFFLGCYVELLPMIDFTDGMPHR